jgi:hypothetical protein
VQPAREVVRLDEVARLLAAVWFRFSSSARTEADIKASPVDAVDLLQTVATVIVCFIRLTF